MRRAVAPLLLALAIVSPLLAQSSAGRDGANHEAASGPTRRTSSSLVTPVSLIGMRPVRPGGEKHEDARLFVPLHLPLQPRAGCDLRLR